MNQEEESEMKTRMKMRMNKPNFVTIITVMLMLMATGIVSYVFALVAPGGINVRCWHIHS
jgi:hypothetical protein